MNAQTQRVDVLAVTPTRRRWLEHLSMHGETAWSRMPVQASRHKIAVSNRTWRPMVDAGLITAEFKAAPFSRGMDWHFAITEKGRAALAGGASHG